MTSKSLIFNKLEQRKVSADTAETLCKLINQVYDVGEAGLWQPGANRTDLAIVQALLQGNKLLFAKHNDNIAGCIKLDIINHDEAEFGMLAVDLAHQKEGIGTALIKAAEGEAIQAGCSTMYLNLLVPIHGTHPVKEFLKVWYERQGYILKAVVPFLAMESEQAAAFLAQPCQFLVYTKHLLPLLL